jgi:predicted DNA-binding transcriptional regulator AlpA
MALHANIPKRGLNLSEAAEYCGVSDKTLDKYGPRPSKIGERNVYDVRVLDRWLDSLASLPIGAAQDDDKQKFLEAVDARRRAALRQNPPQRERHDSLVLDTGRQDDPAAGRSRRQDGGGGPAQ